MLKELVEQVKRLFSSKSNGGKLVYKLTDRLHGYKQALLALSIVILLGYSQFRKHFDCQGQGKIDGKVLTNFCWINGTTTIGLRDPSEAIKYTSAADRYITHVGIQFKQTLDGKYKVINHNYMRSLWALLILMSICSFIAQRWWASIFENEILKALLKLPGHKDLALVKRAQKLKPYEKIQEMSRLKQKIISGEMQKSATGNKKLDRLSVLFHTIDSITGDQNEHNHLMDYYPNQLIYLLLAMRTSAYKLAGLKLRRKLLSYSICSFMQTLMQFLLPLLFIGPEYTYYGYYYAKAWLRYTLKQIIDPRLSVNSIDYELSSRIWPISTSCEYSEYGYHGRERIIVQCTVPINEICAKLFVIIWWFVMLNIVVELWSLLSTLIFSLNFNCVKWKFERKFSPRARKEAKVIATFRYKRAMMLHKLKTGGVGEDRDAFGEVRMNLNNNEQEPPLTVSAATTGEANEREMKLQEAECGDNNASSRISLSAKKWYLWCSRDVCLFLKDKSKKIEPGKLMAKSRSPEDENGYKELLEDMNIYYLMDLMYLRLKCSRKKMEQIVHMTSEALSNYLEVMNRVDEMVVVMEEDEDGEEKVPVIRVDTGV